MIVKMMAYDWKITVTFDGYLNGSGFYWLIRWNSSWFSINIYVFTPQVDDGKHNRVTCKDG